MLHNRFVCGIVHPVVQKQLLTESYLTFTKAVTIIQTVKLAEKGAQQIQSSVDKEPKRYTSFPPLMPNTLVLSRTKMVLAVTNPPAHTATYVGGSTTNKLVHSSQKSITFAINVVTSPKFVRARNISYHRVILLIR